MAAVHEVSPLVVIVGPTASGKSSLAMELARAYNGELICADSRTIYQYMDIGTAKPSAADRKGIPHHMLDIVTPDQPYSAAKFKEAVLRLIKDILARGKLPIMVGGTGLYIDSVIFDFAFLPPGSLEDREQLQSLNVEQLQEKILSKGIPMPENSKNPRHLIRAIETNGAVAVRKGIRSNTIVIGLDISKEKLLENIHKRTQVMIAAGLEPEAKSLAKKYGWEAPGLQAVGYREWHDNGSPDEALSAIESNTIRYAKRQRTWFKRNPHIQWVNNVTEANQLVQKFLQK